MTLTVILAPMLPATGSLFPMGVVSLRVLEMQSFGAPTGILSPMTLAMGSFLPMVALSLTMLAMHSFAAVSLTMISLWPMALRKRTCGAGRRGGGSENAPPDEEARFRQVRERPSEGLARQAGAGGQRECPPSVAWGGGHEKAPRPTGCTPSARCAEACLSRRASDA